MSRESKIDVENEPVAGDDELHTDLEESRVPLRLRQVIGPTVRAHRLNLSCRSWCPVCVAVRSVNHGHKTVRDVLGKQAPEVSFDHGFFYDQPGELFYPCRSAVYALGFSRHFPRAAFRW